MDILESKNDLFQNIRTSLNPSQQAITSDT